MMAQQLRELTILADDSGLGPEPNGSSQPPIVQFQGICHPLLTSVGSGHSQSAHPYRQNTRAHKMKTKEPFKMLLKYKTNTLRKSKLFCSHSERRTRKQGVVNSEIFAPLCAGPQANVKSGS